MSDGTSNCLSEKVLTDRSININDQANTLSYQGSVEPLPAEENVRRRITKWQRGHNLYRMQQGVRMVRVGGKSISNVATSLGLPERTLRRYVDVSKDHARRDNPIFYCPLAQHEKLPKHLRANRSATFVSSPVYSYPTFRFQGDYPDYNHMPNHTTPALVQSIEYGVPKSSSPQSSQQNKFTELNFKRPQRRYINGKKICRCGSTTHKNTLHRECPLNNNKKRKSRKAETLSGMIRRPEDQYYHWNTIGHGIEPYRPVFAQGTAQSNLIYQTISIFEPTRRPIDMLCEAIARRSSVKQTAVKTNTEMPALAPLNCLVDACVTHGTVTNDTKRRRLSEKQIALTRISSPNGEVSNSATASTKFETPIQLLTTLLKDKQSIQMKMNTKELLDQPLHRANIFSKRRLRLSQFRKLQNFTRSYEKSWRLAPLPNSPNDTRVDKRTSSRKNTVVLTKDSVERTSKTDPKKQSQTTPNHDDTDTTSDEGDKCVFSLLALIASANLCYLQDH